MEVIEFISTVTGIIFLGLIIFFSFISSVKNAYNLFLNPMKYIEDNHGDILEHVISKKIKPCESVYKEIVDTSIIETIRDVGISRNIDQQKSVLQILTKKYVSHQIQKEYENYEIEALKLIKQNSKKIQAKIGKKTPTTYQYYVNLRDVLVESKTVTSVSFVLSGFIYKYLEDKNEQFDFIAVNRNSNSILGYLISSFLDIPLLIVNYDSSRWKLNNEEVSVDGLNKLPRKLINKKGFIVDDAVSGGTILKESAKILKSLDLEVKDIFVVFNRKEDNAKEIYSKSNLILHSIFEIGDEEIETLMNTEDNDLEKLINEYVR